MNVRKVILFLIVISSIAIGATLARAQSSEQKTTDFSVQLGTIGFEIRKFEAAPSPVQILELQIEISNPSQKATVPPNAVKVIVLPKAIKFSAEGAQGNFAPPREEVTLTQPLLPRMARTLTIGFQLPKEKLESISFEIQINPPQGETKTATFDF